MILSNVKVYTEQGVLSNSGVVIQDKKITAIDQHAILKKKSHEKFFEFPENYSLVPGFIDLHIHGANGSDVMDANQEALANISQTLAKEGTTGFLATTMTAPPSHIEYVLGEVRNFMQKDNFYGAKMLGVHLEGPFLSPKKFGAQRADELLPLKIEYMQRWQELSNHIIKIVTLAPELPESTEFIKYLKKNNIIAAIGHSDATYAESMAAIESGCTHATHLFNAMRGVHQREPGMVTAALLSDAVMAELIIDGVHLHPAIVQLALKLKGPDKIALVTDAMRAKCLKNGIYDLGGQAVTVKNDMATLPDGTLAGSVLKMNSALRNLIHYTDCNLSDAVQMTSENPARALGIFAKTGSIALNKAADLVVLDEALNVVMTICDGEVVFQH